MRWLLIVVAIAVALILLFLLLFISTLLLDGRRERKMKLKMSPEELYLHEVHTRIRGHLGSELYDHLELEDSDDFFLNARRHVGEQLSEHSENLNLVLRALVSRVCVREAEGVSRTQIASNTDLYWFAYRQALLDFEPSLVPEFIEETSRRGKPQLGRDVVVLRKWHTLISLRFSADAAEEIGEDFRHRKFFRIRDWMLDTLYLSGMEEGEAISTFLQKMDQQSAELLVSPGTSVAATSVTTYVVWATARSVVEAYEPDLLVEFDRKSAEILGDDFAVPDSILTGAKRFTPYDKKRFGLP